MKTQVEPEHYFIESYGTKEHFISYWHQINEIVELNPAIVLEIGIGNGFLSRYLKRKRIEIITLDTDERLNPDLTGSVLNLPFLDKSFDVVACYEVLEHLPYENFKNAVSEIFRVSKSFAILSLPDASRVYPIYIPTIEIGMKNKFKIELKTKLIPIPRLKTPKPDINGEHYWEIGQTGYSLNKINDEIGNVGFEVIETYRIFEMPYHRFFIIKK